MYSNPPNLQDYICRNKIRRTEELCVSEIPVFIRLSWESKSDIGHFWINSIFQNAPMCQGSIFHGKSQTSICWQRNELTRRSKHDWAAAILDSALVSSTSAVTSLSLLREARHKHTGRRAVILFFDLPPWQDSTFVVSVDVFWSYHEKKRYYIFYLRSVDKLFVGLHNPRIACKMAESRSRIFTLA